jgi:hypothetical protein
MIGGVVGLTTPLTGLTGSTTYTVSVASSGVLSSQSQPCAPVTFTTTGGVSTFDHFISPTGSNANPGTLPLPWHLSAVQAKSGSYQRLGIIADQGPYNFAVITPNIAYTSAGFGTPVINAGQGTAANPIFIAGCDSGGNYNGPSSMAVIDANLHPTGAVGEAFNPFPCFGSTQVGAAATGYTTIDSIEVKNAANIGIIVGCGDTGTVSGMQVSNCLVHSIYNFNEGCSCTASMTNGILTVTAISGGTVNVGDSVFYNNRVTGVGPFPIEAYGTGGTTGIGGLGTYATAAAAVSFPSQTPVTISGYAGNNTAGIKVYASINALIQNNFVYDIIDNNTALSSNYRAIGIQTWGCPGVIANLNTVYARNNVGPIAGIEAKNSGQYNMNWTQNYINLRNTITGTTGSGFDAVSADLLAGAGHFATITNNILIHPAVGGFPTVAGSQGYQTISFTWAFNTVVMTETGSFSLLRFMPAGTATINHYCNIYDRTGTPGYRGDVNFDNDSILLTDYNLWTTSGANYGLNPPGGGNPLATYNFATPAQYTAFVAALPVGVTGKESCAPAGAPETGSPTYANASGTGLKATDYQLTVGSKGKGTGQLGGVVGGGATDKGAWGNGVTQVGCTWMDPS